MTNDPNNPELKNLRAEVERLRVEVENERNRADKVYLERVDQLENECDQLNADNTQLVAECAAVKGVLRGCSQRLQVVLAEFNQEKTPTFNTPTPSALENIKAVAKALSTPTGQELLDELQRFRNFIPKVIAPPPP